MGEAHVIIENFKVKNVIMNSGNNNYLEKELIKLLKKKNISYQQESEYSLNYKGYVFNFINDMDTSNENEDSLVFDLAINNTKLLFMGDASITTEKEIIDKYDLPNIDILKVGHHGSKTSSGKEFINKIKPTYSIISVGKKNKFGHPNKEVLNNLVNSKIYRTDKQGSIVLKVSKKLRIKTYNP